MCLLYLELFFIIRHSYRTVKDQEYIVRVVAPLEVVSDGLAPLSEKLFGLNPHMPRDMLVPHQWMSKQIFYI